MKVKMLVFNIKRLTLDELEIDEIYFDEYQKLMQKLYFNSCNEKEYNIKTIIDYKTLKKLIEEGK